jgi:outer membrane protein insertion porin family
MSRSTGGGRRPWRAAFLRGGLALSVLLSAAGLNAQEPVEGRRIVAVEVAGAATVAQETVLANVQTRPGRPYDDAVVSEDIRRLFALGYFTDVRADVEPLREGLRLTFVVKEKPTVAAVEIEGNRALRTPRVRALLPVRAGELYDPRKLKEGVDQLRAEYARKGFADAEILWRPEVDEAANTATLWLLIDEGPRLRVRQILVEGNQAFSDGRIRRLLKTKPKGWIRSGAYQDEVVTEDLERIRAFYRTRGYQDVQVSHRVVREPSGRGLIVHLVIEEGLQHRVGGVAIEGEVLFPERELRQVVTLKPGAVYSAESLQEDLRQLKQYYGDRGYIHAEVTPEPRLDPDAKRVDLAYRISEGERVRVHRVEVRGNLRTQDRVIRRELRIYPGDSFDGEQIRRSLARLDNLGFFEEVNVETEPTDQPNAEDLVVRVKEAKTGSFSFGGGFSSVDRVVGLIELEQRNFDWRNAPTFIGAGQDLRLRVEIGTVRRFFDVSFTEPWAFGHPLSLGFDAYNRTRLRSRRLGLGYEEEQRGGGVRLGHDFTDRLTGGLSYQLFHTEISDVVEEASADLKAEQGRSAVSVTGMSLSWDGRDNRFDPTQGLFVFSFADVAGGLFGADRDFFRLQGGVSHYLPHAGRFVFEARLHTGLVDAYGDSAEVPIFERFFGGGAGTIRGFEERRVGPRDPSSTDPIGGEAMLVGTLEEVLTVVRDERGRSILKGSVFLDVGNVWRRVGDYGESFKVGTGLGARVTTPLGPVRVAVGLPLSDVAGEERKPQFHFNLSRSF